MGVATTKIHFLECLKNQDFQSSFTLKEFFLHSCCIAGLARC